MRFVMNLQEIKTQKSHNNSYSEVEVVRSIGIADQFWPFRYGKARSTESESLRHQVARP